MNPERVIAFYLRIAFEDLEAANALAKIGKRNAIYRCSRAFEKVSLAALTSEGVRAGIGHPCENIQRHRRNSNVRRQY